MTVSSSNPLTGVEIAYFPASGRAESARLALHIGDIEHVDARLDYATLTAKRNGDTKWAGMNFPVLTLKDGRIIGESVDIDRVIGKYAGLYPTDDHIKAALVDNVVSLAMQVFEALASTGSGLATDEEKITARKIAYAADGAVYKKLVALNNFLKATSTSQFAVGDSITVGDIRLFTNLAALQSGFWAGIDAKVLLKDHDEVRRVYNAVANHAKVKDWYSLEKNTNDGGHRSTFLTAFDY